MYCDSLIRVPFDAFVSRVKYSACFTAGFEILDGDENAAVVSVVKEVVVFEDSLPGQACISAEVDPGNALEGLAHHACCHDYARCRLGTHNAG